MSIISPAPIDIRDCELYKCLQYKSKPEDGLLEKVSTLISTTTPMLDLIIAGPFREYTLHNQNHAKKLVHLSANIMKSETINALSPLEIAVIIMSCYLHDLGMVLTQKEREGLLANQDFLDELKNWNEVYQEINYIRHKHDETKEEDKKLIYEEKLFQLQEAALAAYLRPRHANPERYRNILKYIKENTKRNDLFEVKGVSFENELIEVCCSHVLDVGVLLETEGAYRDRFPRTLPISGMNLNLQFCAAILRITDILDFDRERTPKALFEALNLNDCSIPGRSFSLKEWNRHMAVHSLDISEYEILISSTSSHPAIEKSILDFSQIIEREIRDTLAVLRKNPDEIYSVYQIHLPLSVRANIRSDGYVYKDLSFKLDESSISSLLMGESLYSNKSVALRELTQNAIDACRLRAMLTKKTNSEFQVAISAREDDRNKVWLEVTDNGIGMDEFVLSEYFFKVGNSYYKSPEFHRFLEKSPDIFAPISRFGIGILSVFMAGDILEVSTRNLLSIRKDTIHRTIRIEGRSGLAYITEDNKGEQGTKISLRLNFSSSTIAWLFVEQAITYLKNNIRRPAVNILVDLPNNKFQIVPDTFMEFADGAEEIITSKNIKIVKISLENYSETMTGKIFIFFYRHDDGLLYPYPSERKVTYKYLEFAPYLINYFGNKITVNGISMSLSKLSRVFGKKGNKLQGAIDIDIVGDDEIQYDVARDKIVGAGRINIYREIRRVILECLKNDGNLPMLSESSMTILDKLGKLQEYYDKTSIKYIDDEKILSSVQSLLPSGDWPIGLHSTIASKLGISQSTSYRAVSTLIALGRVKH